MTHSVMSLVVVEGPGVGTQYQLLSDMVLLGRAKECDILLEGVKGISRKHIQAFVSGDKLRLKDLGSQNGMLVQGQRAADVMLPIGGEFKIGEITFRLESSQPVVAAASTEAQNIESQALNAPDGFDAESAMAAAGKGSAGALLWLIFIVLLIVFGFYLTKYSSSGIDPSQMQVRVIRRKQARVMNFKTQFFDFKSPNVKGQKLITAYKYNGILKSTLEEANNKKGSFKRDYLVVEGKVEGDADLILYDSVGSQISSHRILVRGSLRSKWPEMDKNTAIDISDQLIRDAEVLSEDGFLYAASKKYKEAEELINEYIGDADVSADARNKRKDLENKIKHELQRIFREAMLAAFPNDPKKVKRNFRAAVQHLNEAKYIVPDEDCHEWQILDHWQAEFKRQIIR